MDLSGEDAPHRTSTRGSRTAVWWSDTQKRVDLGHDSGPFPDSGGNTLCRARPNITDRKYAPATGLERPRRAVDDAGVRTAGDDEALVVKPHAVREPSSVRIGTDEQEQMA